MTQKNNILERIPELLEQLVKGEVFKIKDLTNGKIEEVLKTKNAVAGVYLFTRDDEPEQYQYVGRSSNLAVRIGTDHRSKDTRLTPIGNFLVNEKEAKSLEEARQIIFEHYSVRFLPVPDTNIRAMLEIFVGNELQTKNTFIEH